MRLGLACGVLVVMTLGGCVETYEYYGPTEPIYVPSRHDVWVDQPPPRPQHPEAFLPPPGPMFPPPERGHRPPLAGMDDEPLPPMLPPVMRDERPRPPRDCDGDSWHRCRG